MRVDVECGNSIRAILDGNKFPGNLTELQADTVLEAASWCANHALRQGLEWLRGSQTVSLGQISTGQTNPEEPDYFLPFLYKKLVGVGLVKFIQAGNISVEEERDDPMFTWKGTDREFWPPSLDFLKKAYIAKKGQNSLTSRDNSIIIKVNGGLYDGVDLKANVRFPEIPKIPAGLLDIDKVVEKSGPALAYKEDLRNHIYNSNELVPVYELNKLEKRLPNTPAFEEIKQKIKALETNLQTLKDDLAKLEESHNEDIGTVNKEIKELDENVPFLELIKKL